MHKIEKSYLVKNSVQNFSNKNFSQASVPNANPFSFSRTSAIKFPLRTSQNEFISFLRGEKIGNFVKRSLKKLEFRVAEKIFEFHQAIVEKHPVFYKDIAEAKSSFRQLVLINYKKFRQSLT